NKGAEDLLGYTPEEMLNRTWSSEEMAYANPLGVVFPELECPLHEVIATGKPTTSKLRMRHADGDWQQVEVQTVPLLDQGCRFQGVVEIFRDLSRETKQPAEFRQLRMAACRDPLTSVANRGELETQLDELLTAFKADNAQHPFSVIFLDVDFFKQVNDRHG